jgi:hypothetical protein
MLPPKEKAKELVNNFSLQMPVQIIPIASTRVNQLSCDMDLKAHLKNAKQCALIAVQEIIDQWEYIDTYLANLNGEFNPNLHYWQEVENELNKSE